MDLGYLRTLVESQGFRCALSGDDLVIGGGWNSPSIDKIDPTLGYVKGNVQWLTKRMNLIKNNLTNDQFFEFCRKCLGRSETMTYSPSGAEAPSPQ